MIELLKELREQVSGQGQDKIDELLQSVRSAMALIAAYSLLTLNRLSKTLLMPPRAYKRILIETMTQKAIKTMIRGQSSTFALKLETPQTTSCQKETRTLRDAPTDRSKQHGITCYGHIHQASPSSLANRLVRGHCRVSGIGR